MGIPVLPCHEAIVLLAKKARIDGLVQERRNFSELAMELLLSCANPSICLWRKGIDRRCLCGKHSCL